MDKSQNRGKDLLRTKSKLAALAKEIASWEDDVRHVPLNQSTNNKNLITMKSNKTNRDSLAENDQLPVQARAARWERLINKSLPDVKEILSVNSSIAEIKSTPQLSSGRERIQPVVIKPNIHPDVPLGSHTQSERERLERMKELAALRRCRKPFVSLDNNPSEKEVSLAAKGGSERVLQHTPAVEIVDCEKLHDDFSLPSPPPFEFGAIKSTTDAEISESFCMNTSASSVLSNLQGFDNIQHAPLNDKFDTHLSTSHDCIEPNENNDHVDGEDAQVLDETSKDDLHTDDGVSNYVDAVFDSENPYEIDSVSSFSVDNRMSNVECTTNDDCDNTVLMHSYYNRPRLGSKRRASLSESSANDNLPSAAMQRTVTFQAPRGTAPGDTESEMYTESEFDTDADYGGSLAHCRNSFFLQLSRDKNCANSDDINSEISSFIDAAFDNETNPYDIESVSSLESNKCRRSFSKDDFDIMVKKNSKPTLPLSEAQRRSVRLAELPSLIEAQRNIILQASAALQLCASHHQLHQQQQDTSGFLLSTPRRLKVAAVNNNNNNNKHSSDIGPGSRAHIEASRTMLIACQRRQVLMEELSLLHRGSPVLIPPNRGDPIRARMKLKAVRLSLKTSHAPNDPTSGGGFLVVSDEDVRPSRTDQGRLGQPTQYNLLVIMKCRGEGRLYYSKLVTLMHISDFPIGSGRPAAYVDLPMDIEIVPVRPDFVFSLEIYCMRTGSDRPMNLNAFGSPRVLGVDTDYEIVGRTPKSSKNPFSSLSKKARMGHQEMTGLGMQKALTGIDTMSVYSNGSSSSNSTYMTNSLSGTINDNNKVTAFVLISSVDINYNDNLLFGASAPPPQAKLTSSARSDQSYCLPLTLPRLPRSSPLCGSAALVNASVNLEARVLTRGFLNVFEEVGGLGVWRRYWCQLRADYLQFWSDPKDEEEYLSKTSSTNHGPLGRIDLCHVVAPGAVQAPRRICVRANTLYMRSLREIDHRCLSASVQNASDQVGSALTDTTESLIFRASTDYGWLEQKVLLCADTPRECDDWIVWLNTCLKALRNWMPQRFACLSRFDAQLEFGQPVSSYLAALLTHPTRQNSSAD